MKLPGIVTNITAFGVFVDVGVHQDGLVHISELADRFVKDPSDVVKVHQKVTVTVLDVDLQRKRIVLSMKNGNKRGSENKLGSSEARKLGSEDKRGSSEARKPGSQKRENAASGSGLKHNKKKKVPSRFEGNPFYEAFKKNGVVD
jgi:uncharacterized protein